MKTLRSLFLTCMIAQFLSDMQGNPTVSNCCTSDAATSNNQTLTDLQQQMVYNRALIAEAGSDLTENDFQHLSGYFRKVVLKENETFGKLTVASVAPNGKIIACGTDNTIIDILAEDNYEIIARLQGKGYGVASLCFSPDNRYLAAGFNDQKICIWDLPQLAHAADDAQMVITLQGHPAPINFLCFSPDGKYLVSGSTGSREDATVYVWDEANFTHNLSKPLARLGKGSGAVHDLCLSPNSSILVAAFEQGVIRAWNLNNIIDGTPARTSWVGSRTHVSTLCFLAKGRYLATGDLNGMINIWDMATAKRNVDPIQSFRCNGQIKSLIAPYDDYYLTALCQTNQGTSFFTGRLSDDIHSLELWGTQENDGVPLHKLYQFPCDYRLLGIMPPSSGCALSVYTPFFSLPSPWIQLLIKVYQCRLGWDNLSTNEIEMMQSIPLQARPPWLTLIPTDNHHTHLPELPDDWILTLSGDENDLPSQPLNIAQRTQHIFY